MMAKPMKSLKYLLYYPMIQFLIIIMINTSVKHLARLTKYLVNCYPLDQFQKISIPPQKELEFPGMGVGSVRPKDLKKRLKLNHNFQMGRGTSVVNRRPM